jgi:hypothetical protein
MTWTFHGESFGDCSEDLGGTGDVGIVVILGIAKPIHNDLKVSLIAIVPGIGLGAYKIFESVLGKDVDVGRVLKGFDVGKRRGGCQKVTTRLQYPVNFIHQMDERKYIFRIIAQQNSLTESKKLDSKGKPVSAGFACL